MEIFHLKKLEVQKSFTFKKSKEKIGPIVPDTILRSRKLTNKIEYSKIGLELLRKLVLYWKR
ncbi:Uncharacterised protein [Streptococcus pneumoniae]|nr:Uncharacterised protein [Streptococcus pneumoniae]